MKKVIAIPGSNSSNSINKKFVAWAASQIQDAEVELLDLNDFEMPIYSIDRENAEGVPDKAKSFASKIFAADAVLLSLAEHNGSYAAAFKNIIDWASRLEQKLWENKKMLLMASSPGGRGGKAVTAAAELYFPHMGADIVATFNLPKFHENFEEGIKDKELNDQFSDAISSFQGALN